MNIQISLKHRAVNSNKHSNKHTLKKKSIVAALENLHTNFIVAQIDGANGNIAFICKSLFVNNQQCIQDIYNGKHHQ